MQATRDQGQPDEYLAAQAATGDEAAFAALYERHFDGVYDFALRTTRRPEVAANVVQTTFTRAWDGIRKGKAGKDLQVWLYLLARKTALDLLPRSRRSADGSEPQEFIGRPPAFAQLGASTSPRVQAALEDHELLEIVWNAAAVLTPKQYSLLDLHLRRRITADELSEGLHVTKSHVYTMLSRLRAAIADTVVYDLLLRRGRAECRELAFTLSQIQGSPYGKKARRTVQQHVRTCNRCQAGKRQYVSPLDVFAALVLIPAAPGVKGSVWQRVSSYIKGLPLPQDRRERSGPAPALPPFLAAINPRVAAAVAGVLALVVFIVLGTLLFTSGGSSGADAADPADVRSADRQPGEPSSDNTIEMEWTAVRGAKAYSIQWSEKPQDLPDTQPDLPGTATGTTSPSLQPGIWYFHLRTQGDNDGWTSTVHAGPFEITGDESDATPRPTQTPPPGTPSPTPTVVPIPRFPPVVPPQTPTPAPTPAPTEPPTPEPTPPPVTPPPTPAPTPAPSPAPSTAAPTQTP